VADDATDNDAYNGLLRDIVFPSDILRPIFDQRRSAFNYGAAGA
jgi:predicted metalloendopeptidase